MAQPNTVCDPAAIERLLADRLTEEERAGVETHLDQCATCRERLETSAAAPGLWSEAREFLSSAGDLSDGPPSRASSDVSLAAETDGERSDHILAFLVATDDPRM